MKRTHNSTGWLIVFLLLSLALPLMAVAKDVPHKIAGIALGTTIEDYPEIVPSNFLKEVVVTDWHGFRKGVISYGTCKYIDQILKIDMKYQDRSKKFFDVLLKKFSKKFGKPTVWSGDSFGVVHIWKWRFVDKEQNRVGLVLQYNSKNSNETIGNIVKLSYPDRIEEERRCFVEVCHHTKKQTDMKRREELQKSDWSHLVPQ